jgi:hypothetical protein
MADIFSGIGGILALIFLIISILAPIWLYLINVYTGGSRDELKKIRKLLEKMAEQQARQPVIQQEPAKTAGSATCGVCGKTTPYPAKYAGQTKPCPGCKNPMLLKPS